MGSSRRNYVLKHALGRFVLLCAVLAGPVLAEPEHAEAVLSAYSDKSLDSYTLFVRLNQEQHKLEGRGTIVWTNRSSVPVTELYWHMYLNAFRDQKTFFFRDSELRARSRRTLTNPGSIEFTELRITSPYSKNILDQVEAHSPNDPLDRTDLPVALPRSLAAGETLKIDIAFVAHLPSIVERTGVSRDFTLAGQWFPKLAVLEKDGHWEHFRFHPFSEFYAEFANYDVTLEVPSNMIVGATGQLVNAQDITQNRPTQRRRYLAPAVHDFAWTAWPHFLNLAKRVDDTEVLILYPPGHERNAKATLRTVEQALPHFEQRFGSYPHSTLTIVHPPVHAAAAGGMEYPSFITTGGAWYSTLFSQAVPTVTIHELAHQWFQGSLASDEHRWPFLDEGLTSYVESREGTLQFGSASTLSWAGWELSTLALHRANLLIDEHDDPLGNATADFQSFDELGAVIYSRSVLLMQTLGNVYGQEFLDELLLRYATKFAGRHPTLNNFLQELAPLGAQATKTLHAVLERGSSVDFQLRELQNEPDGNNGFVSRIIVERVGELVFPVEILLERANGRQQREQWSGQQHAYTLEVHGSSPVVRAWIDPDSQILLDENLLNNVLASSPRLPLNYFERLLYALQVSLAWFLS